MDLPHLPHSWPLGTFLQVPFFLDYPEVVSGVTAAFRERPYMVNVMFLWVELLAFQIPLNDRQSRRLRDGS